MTLHRLASARFEEKAAAALADPVLQGNLARLKGNFLRRRERARASLPEFDALRDAAVEIKSHTLDHLDLYLEAFEDAVRACGGQVHWARDDTEARGQVLEICRAAGARTVAKGKTMVAEEIGLNPFLEAHGVEPVETDLGEYIVQLAQEPPSHIIAPAIHKNRRQVAALFNAHHENLADRAADDLDGLLADARAVLRRTFLQADVGITGANFLIAETGQTAIVTNEGNGDLTQLLPRVHVVLAGIEKVVPTLEDAACILRVLARSATGQEMSSYTTFSAGPRRPDDPDGPDAFHVVLVDNGRAALLGSPTAEILRCIRCGCCLNACPVYGKVGGHAYGSAYPGPVGAVLTPALAGLDETGISPTPPRSAGAARRSAPCASRSRRCCAISARRRRRRAAPRLRRGAASPCGPFSPAGPGSTAGSRASPRRAARRAGTASRALRAPAGRRRLDARPRPRRAAGDDVPDAMVPGRTAVNAREAVLDRIRRGVGRGKADEGSARAAVAARLAARGRCAPPARIALDREAPVDLFAGKRGRPTPPSPSSRARPTRPRPWPIT